MPKTLVVVASIGLASLARAQEPAHDALRSDIELARRAVYPALVNISVVKRVFGDGRAQRSPGAGSGVIVDAQGHVLTNFHVAGHTTRISCTLPNGETIPANVVAHDPLTDLSVLRLDRDPGGAPLPWARFGDSDSLDIGDPVLAMGNPLSLSSSLTLGVLSNTKRVFTDFTGSSLVEMDLGEGETTGLFTRWIQHDALILPGNSGGPLVNLAGEVVGINELGGGGVGFAIPSNLARAVFEQIVASGEVRRGWLGFTVLPTAKMGGRGALVAWVSPASPAEKAGIRAGDVVTALDGAPVACRYFEEVPLVYQSIALIEPGKTVTISVTRAGKDLELAAKVDPMEPMLGEEDEVRRIGATVRRITGTMALARRLRTRDGVLVTGVRPGFPFEEARPPLAQDDIVRSVAGTSTPTLEAFVKAVEAAHGEITVSFLRGEESLLTSVKLGSAAASGAGGQLPRAWLGIKTQVMTPPIAAAMAMPGTKGFRITRVFPGTEAAKAGLAPDDVITAIGGVALVASRPQDAQDLSRLIEAMSIGEPARLTVARGSSSREHVVPLEATPRSADDMDRRKEEVLELTVRDVSRMDRFEKLLQDAERGVIVVDATNGGLAQMAGLQAGDLILDIDGEPTTDVVRFGRVMERINAARPKVVTFFVKRQWRTLFVFIEPDWSPEGAPAGGAPERK